MTRIVWTLEENIKLARQAALIRETNPKMSVIALAREAQSQVLTPSRQRVALVAASNVPVFIEQLAIAEKELKSLRAKEARKAEAARIEQEQLAQRAADEVTAAAKPAPEGEPEPEAAEPGPTVIPSPAPSVAAPILAFPVDQLLPFSELETALSQLFRRAMFRAFVNETPPPATMGIPETRTTTTTAVGQGRTSPGGFNGAAADMGRPMNATAAPELYLETEPEPAPAKLGEFNMAPVPTPAPRAQRLSVVPKHNPEPQSSIGGERLPRVILIGVLGDQGETLVKDFAGQLDIRHFPNDAHPRAVANAAEGAALTLLCKKFIPHALTDAVKDKTVQFSHVKGAVSDIRHYLQRWLQRTPDERDAATVAHMLRVG